MSAPRQFPATGCLLLRVVLDDLRDVAGAELILRFTCGKGFAHRLLEGVVQSTREILKIATVPKNGDGPPVRG